MLSDSHYKQNHLFLDTKIKINPVLEIVNSVEQCLEFLNLQNCLADKRIIECSQN